MYKGRVSKDCEAVTYRMPSLEREEAQEDNLSSLQKIEEIERQAYEKGFASGEKAGFASGEQKASILIEGLEKIIRELRAIRDDLIKDLEPQVVDLAMTIARKVIIEEITMRPEIIVTMVKEALRRLDRTGTITIKISPAIHDLFKRKKPELLEIHQDIIFDVDPHVAVTGPLVISQREEVVTDIDSLLSSIMNEMRDKNTQTEQ